jgi:hypothetical protein
MEVFFGSDPEANGHPPAPPSRFASQVGTPDHER